MKAVCRWGQSSVHPGRAKVQDKLLFIIGAPRSGSTLLNRMLGGHSEIHAPAEPHILTPLAHLGYYARVDEAPYDPIIAQLGIRELVPCLPLGEKSYRESLRAYSDHLYEGLLAGSSARYLLDKTPAYALVLDFITRLYPDARYVILTRHPMAIWSSVVDSFFDGDHVLAHEHNPILERYIPAMARFLREPPRRSMHIPYEALVADPEAHMRSFCDFADLEFQPDMVDYGKASSEGAASRGLGDPMTVAGQSRPVTDSLTKWAGQLSGRPDRIRQAQDILARLDDRDLDTWGFDRATLAAELAAIDPAAPPKKGPKLSRHVLERRVMMAVRRRVGDNWLGRGIRKLREICDLLLR